MDLAAGGPHIPRPEKSDAATGRESGLRLVRKETFLSELTEYGSPLSTFPRGPACPVSHDQAAAYRVVIGTPEESQAEWDKRPAARPQGPRDRPRVTTRERRLKVMGPQGESTPGQHPRDLPLAV